MQVLFLYIIGTSKILRAIVLLFVSDFFESFLCDVKFLSFQLYWLLKSLIFDIFSGWLLICSRFNAAVIEYWKHLSLFF